MQEKPTCYYARGVAYVQPTADNIQHLLDVGEDDCTAEANDCVRVSYLDQSGLFFCNYVCHPSLMSRAESLTRIEHCSHYYQMSEPCQSSLQATLQLPNFELLHVWYCWRYHPEWGRRGGILPENCGRDTLTREIRYFPDRTVGHGKASGDIMQFKASAEIIVPPRTFPLMICSKSRCT